MSLVSTRDDESIIVQQRQVRNRRHLTSICNSSPISVVMVQQQRHHLERRFFLSSSMSANQEQGRGDLENNDNDRSLSSFSEADESTGEEVVVINDDGTTTMQLLSTTYDSTKSSSGFLFNIRAKKNNDDDDDDGGMMIHGMEVNVINPEAYGITSGLRLLVYTKEGRFDSYEANEAAWTLWMNVTIDGGMVGKHEMPTRLPPLARRRRRRQIVEESGVDYDDFNVDIIEPIFVAAGARRAFYISAPDGPFVRYSDVLTSNDQYYQDDSVIIFANGAAKRLGWDGMTLSPRLFNGALYYSRIVGEEAAAAVNDDDATTVTDSVTSLPATLAPSQSITASFVTAVPTPSIDTFAPSSTNEAFLNSSPEHTLSTSSATTYAPSTILTTTLVPPPAFILPLQPAEILLEANNTTEDPASYFYYCNDNEVDDQDKADTYDDSIEEAGGLSSIHELTTTATTTATTVEEDPQLMKFLLKFDYDLFLTNSNSTISASSKILTTTNSNAPTVVMAERAVIQFERLLLTYVGRGLSKNETPTCAGTPILHDGKIRLSKLSSLPNDMILTDKSCAKNSLLLLPLKNAINSTTTSACYPIAGYMTVYYYQTNDNGTTTMSNITTSNEEVDNVNADIAATIEEVIQQAIYTMTENDDISTIIDNSDNLVVRLYLSSADRGDALSMPGEQEEKLDVKEATISRSNFIISVATGVGLAVIAVALLACVVMRRRAKGKSPNAEEREVEGNDLYENSSNIRQEDEEEYGGDEIDVIPSRQRYYGDNYDNDGLSRISKQRQSQQHMLKPSRTWGSILALSPTYDTETTPVRSNRTASRRYPKTGR